MISITDKKKYSNYFQISQLYGTQLAKNIPYYLLLTKKWQDQDLIWPHSDIDFRIILGETPPNWIELNTQIFNIHASLVRQNRILYRILEHPPGFIYLKNELMLGLASAADLQNWSWCHGSKSFFFELKKIYKAMNWSEVDYRYYQAILKERLDHYQLINDASDNVTIEKFFYPIHCICWHFFAPAWFALMAISYHRRFSGKMDSLSLRKESRYFLEIAKKNYRFSDDKDILFIRAKKLLKRSSIFTPYINDSIDNGKPDKKPYFIFSIAMLRCRLSRFLYYLNPPSGVEVEYLIYRETKELNHIVQTLKEISKQLTKVKKEHLCTILSLFPSEPLNKKKLESLVHNMYSHQQLFDKIFNNPEEYLA